MTSVYVRFACRDNSLGQSQTDGATADADIVLREVSLGRCAGVAQPTNQRRQRADEGGAELLIDVGGQSRWRRRAGTCCDVLPASEQQQQQQLSSRPTRNH